MTTSSPFPLTRPNKAWAGRWLLAIALVHTVVAFVLFADPLLDIARHGVFDSIGRDPLRAAAVWFLLFGVMTGLCGVALTSLEKTSDDIKTLRSIGVGMLLLAVLGVVLMPVSGLWLALPPAIALLLKRDL